VSGYSAWQIFVVRELHKGARPARGLFASGTFDQYKRDVPYAIVGPRIFGAARPPILGQSEAELGR